MATRGMSLNPQLLSAAGAELRRAVFEPPRGEHDVYMLKMLGSPPTWVPLVHAEPVLAECFRAGEVLAFDLHRLEQNGPAMRALREQPQSLICGVRLKDGSVISSVPRCLMPIRRTYALRAAAVLIVAGISSFMGAWAAAAFALLLCTLLARKALLIPVRPLAGLAEAQRFSKMPPAWESANTAGSTSTT